MTHDHQAAMPPRSPAAGEPAEPKAALGSAGAPEFVDALSASSAAAAKARRHGHTMDLLRQALSWAEIAGHIDGLEDAPILRLENGGTALPSDLGLPNSELVAGIRTFIRDRWIGAARELLTTLIKDYGAERDRVIEALEADGISWARELLA